MAKAKSEVKEKVKSKSEDKSKDGVPYTGEFQIRVLKETAESIQVKLDNVRLTFVYLDKPQVNDDGKASYVVTSLIPKSPTNLNILRNLAEKIIKSSTKFQGQDRKEIFKTAVSMGPGSMFRDGDKQVNKDGKPYAGCPGTYTLVAKNTAEGSEGDWSPKSEMQLVRVDKSTVQAHEIKREFYSGVVVSIVINLAAYNVKGKRGVSGWIAGIQKLADGPKLSGTPDFFEAREDLAHSDTEVATGEGW